MTTMAIGIMPQEKIPERLLAEVCPQLYLKKSIPLCCILLCFLPAAFAANNINNLGALNQSEFHALSEDLGSALSYKPMEPATPLGLLGFDVGVGFTQTDMAKSSALWSKITDGGSSVNSLYLPRLQIEKGLPFGIDVGAFYAKDPTSNISLYGGEARYALLGGGVTEPAVAVRGAFTRLSGVSQLTLDTKSIDLSVSKGFAMLTPYAGIGEVWVSSTANAGGLAAENFTQNKVFLGTDLNLGFSNLDAEWDRTGAARSISMKLGFRF